MATAFIRTIVLYFLIMVGLRLLGKRQIGELEPIELVLTLLISDLAAVPMQDFGIPLLNGVIPIVTLLSLSMLLSWEDDKFYDRLGLDENDTTILDVPVPQITIPVSAGRNLAAIVELAAMNNRQKKHGFNSAREFAAQIDGHIDRVTRENELKNQNP